MFSQLQFYQHNYQSASSPFLLTISQSLHSGEWDPSFITFSFPYCHHNDDDEDHDGDDGNDGDDDNDDNDGDDDRDVDDDNDDNDGDDDGDGDDDDDDDDIPPGLICSYEA